MTTPPGPRSALARLSRLSNGDRLLLAEALVALASARLALRTLPFRTVADRAARPPARRTPIDPEADILRTRWAIRAAARRVPFRAMCLEQGLAASRLLGRRGIGCTLYYGVRRSPDAGLQAHLWVRAGERDVIGTEGLESFSLLAEYGPRADGEPAPETGAR